MNYHNILHDDILNGEDLGVVLFVSGCNHNCYNCQNPQTHNFNSGILFDEKAKQEIFEQLEKDYIHRITYSGGCPLCGPNRSEITKLAKEIKTKYPKIKQWCYCGEKFEEVKHLEVLKYIDVLVDGKFVQELADVNYPYAGSTNQSLIDVQKSLETGRIILYCKQEK